MRRQRSVWLLVSWIAVGVGACADDEAGTARAQAATTVAPTTTWATPAPGTVTSAVRPLPTASTPSAAWTQVFTLPYGDGDGEVGRGADAAVPLGRGAWIVVDPTNDEVRIIELDGDDGSLLDDASPLPAGAASTVTVPLVAVGRYVAPTAGGGLVVEDQLGDPAFIDTGEKGAEWVYSDGVSLFSTDGRALDRAWNDEISVRQVEAFRTPSDDRFRVHVDGATVLVDLFDLDRRIRVDVGAPADVEFDADLSGTVHVLVRAGTRAGYLSITQQGEVSDVEPVPAEAHLRVVPSTTTVALSAASPDGLHVWTRVAPDTIGIVSADLPEETCQWVRDYAVDNDHLWPSTMRLEQGAVPGFERGDAWLESADGVFRPDLDGDGARDAAFVVWCAVGRSGNNAEVHTIDSNGRSLGWFEVGEDSQTRRLWSFTVEGRDLVVTYPTWDIDEAGCCATVAVTDRYRWTDGALTRVDRHTWSAADAARDILDAFNRDADHAIDRADPDAFVALRGMRNDHGELRGCESTANAPGDGFARTCVITAADQPGADYRLTLTWIDIDEWRATDLEPISDRP